MEQESRNEMDLVQLVKGRVARTRHALDGISIDSLLPIADVIASTLMSGGTVFAAGNGGSSEQAHHLVSELVGRFETDRAGLRAIALGMDFATLSAVANDLGYHEAYARQLRALSKKGDLLFALSTSGESENLVNACYCANEIGLTVISFVGPSDCRIASQSTHVFSVPDQETFVVQELHLVGIHAICWIVERRLA